MHKQDYERQKTHEQKMQAIKDSSARREQDNADTIASLREHVQKLEWELLGVSVQSDSLQKQLATLCCALDSNQMQRLKAALLASRQY